MVVIEVPDLAPLDDSIDVSGTYFDVDFEEYFARSTTVTWRWIFACIAPYLVTNPDEATVQSILASDLFRDSRLTAINHTFDDQDFQTIKIQLLALRLISVQYRQLLLEGWLSLGR